MTFSSPIKPSSRAGRFKKKLVSLDELLSESHVMEAKMAPLLELHSKNILSDSDFTTLYIMTYLSVRYPGQWLGAKKKLTSAVAEMKVNWRPYLTHLEPNILRRLSDVTTLGEILSGFAFKATPLPVNRALLAWARADYKLELMFRIPLPKEILQQQKQGRRCVTVQTMSKKTRDYILGDRDALSFTLHDLIHADHFFHSEHHHEGQIGFYCLMDHCLKENLFVSLKHHLKFMQEFEYLISDMNAYPVHLLKCLKASMIQFHPMGKCFFDEWTKMVCASQSVAQALVDLNTATYVSSKQDEILLGWLNEWRASQNFQALLVNT